MGAVIDLPRTCAPLTLEVRGETVYVGDRDATIASNEGRPISESALRVRGQGEIVRGQPIPTVLEWSVGGEHLDALRKVLARAQRLVAGRGGEPSGATAKLAADGSLVVSGGRAWSYGLVLRDGTWEQTSVVEVLHGDLPVLAVALADVGE